MNVVVLGAGAVGAYYGGALARAGHDVTCYARGQNLAALRERGIEIRTPEESHTVRLNATYAEAAAVLEESELAAALWTVAIANARNRITLGSGMDPRRLRAAT